MTKPDPKVVRAACVVVAPELAWHDIGCIKRYGGECDAPCDCELRQQLARNGRSLGRGVDDAFPEDSGRPPIPSPRDIAIQSAGALLDEAGADLADDLDMALRDFTVRTRRVVTAIRVTPLPDGTYKIGLTVRRITA